MSTQPTSYNPNTPQLTSETLNDSGSQMQINFQKLYENFEKNHVPLDSVTNQGNHTIIQLIEQPENSGIQTDLGEVSVYVKDVAEQADQIFLEYQGNGQEIQYTNYQLYKPEDNDFQDKYFTFLPGKILLYFGVIRPTTNANILDLSPYISKKIINISLCPIAVGTTSFFKPNVELLSPKDGIYQGIKIKASVASAGGGLTGVSRNIPNCYYMVMANV